MIRVGTWRSCWEAMTTDRAPAGHVGRPDSPPPPQLNETAYQNILCEEFDPDKDRALTARFRKDPKLFIERFLWIKTKTRGVIRFILNTPQKLVYEIIQRLRAAGKPIRLVVLKARQMGVSTLIQALLFAFTRLYPGFNALIMAQDVPTASEIFQMFERYLDKLPNRFKPMIRYRRKDLIRFENPDQVSRETKPGLGSQVQIAPAKNLDFGAGFTLHGCHLSEFARWKKHARKILLNIMATMPKTPDTLLAVESTAQGLGGDFYRLWRLASTGKTQWTPVFLPFWVDPQYEVDLTPEEEAEIWRTLRPDEQELVKKFNRDGRKVITARKLAWRRNCIATDCNNSVTEFNQEYPPDAESAFAARAETAFDTTALRHYLGMCREGRRGRLALVRGVPQFVLDPHGPLLVWKPPEPGEHYIVGCDSAMGLRAKKQLKQMVQGIQEVQDFDAQDEDEDEDDPDYSAGVVMSWRREVVAQFVDGTIDPMEFAEELRLLALWYNRAICNVEASAGGGGWAVVWRLKDIYPNICRWEKWDDKSKKIQNVIGWEAIPKSRQVLEGLMFKEVRRGAGLLSQIQEGKDRHLPRLRMYSREILSQMYSYTVRGAAHGSHDDLVRCFGLCLVGLEQVPLPPTAADVRNQKAVGVDNVGYNQKGVSEELSGGGFWPSWY